jgi:hypothetical protein
MRAIMAVTTDSRPAKYENGEVFGCVLLFSISNMNLRSSLSTNNVIRLAIIAPNK